jgi:hypothetical protein
VLRVVLLEAKKTQDSLTPPRYHVASFPFLEISWTAPAHLRLGEATWLVPFAGVTAGFVVTDTDANLHLGGSSQTLHRYTNISNYGLAGMAGAGASLYLVGKLTNDAHRRETGLLSTAIRKYSDVF